MRLLKLFALLATLTAAAAAAAQADVGPPWGPETPNFNLQAVLHPAAGGPDNGFGLVKFRQPNESDETQTILLDVWVRDLAPNHLYYVQRAVDTNVNDDCTGMNWTMPTLGTITTDDRGTGRAALSRDLPAAVQPGATFDIHFRIAETPTAASGVLESGCYQFTVSQ
jgi:hypothetical protein